MINPLQISKIVSRTLDNMNQKETTLKNLIKGTFAIESGLKNLYDTSNDYNKRRGLMLMSDTRIEETVNEFIKFKPTLREQIYTATGFDLREEDIENVKEMLEVNIELMVAVLYSFYSSKYDVVPEDNLEAISAYYKKYYDTEDRNKREEFINIYRQTFMN